MNISQLSICENKRSLYEFMRKRTIVGLTILGKSSVLMYFYLDLYIDGRPYYPYLCEDP